MPTISVFTPSHNPRYLDECWASLASQTYTDFEWIVLLNGDAEWTPPDDPRIVVWHSQITGVGALKAEAVFVSKGEYLVELDHDDVLVDDALTKILSAFLWHPDVGLVYSDCSQINHDGTPNLDMFAEGNGWTYRTESDHLVCESKPPTPHNVSYIWYAPNHVRAFRRSTYNQVGGYNHDLTVCDDLDLMARMYQHSPFYHIPELLYYQRIHHNNTQKTQNALIQSETVRLYDDNIQPNALAWAKRNDLWTLDLGGAHNLPDGYTAIDKAIDGYDALYTLSQFNDNSVGVIRAVDFLEHIANPIPLMNEIYRVLSPGGMVLTLTPSTDGRGAFCDPTHVSFWNELSFRYYCDPEFQKYTPEITTRFTQSRLVTYFPTPWHESNNVPYVCWNGTKQ